MTRFSVPTINGPPLSAYEIHTQSINREYCSMIITIYPARIDSSLFVTCADLCVLDFCLLPLWLVPLPACLRSYHVDTGFLQHRCPAACRKYNVHDAIFANLLARHLADNIFELSPAILEQNWVCWILVLGFIECESTNLVQRSCLFRFFAWNQCDKYFKYSCKCPFDIYL